METKITQAVILAGGQGTRLRPFTLTNPKPMFPIHGKPALEYLIGQLRDNGIKDILLLLGYLPEKISDYFGDGSEFGVRITYAVSPVEDDTGTRIRKAAHLLREKFLLLYCDNYWPLQLDKLWEFYESKKTLASMVVYGNKDGSSKSNTIVDENGMVILYDKSRTASGLHGVEIGFFIIDKKVLDLLPEDNVNFEASVLPQLVAQKQLAGYLTDHKYYSTGSMDRIPFLEKFLAPRKIALLDRDGVINKKAAKADYVKTWGEFEFLPMAIDGLKFLTRQGYELFLITNQPGIARGKMTMEDYEIITRNMERELAKHGVKFSGIYVCFHNWDDGCECRKPKPGLLFQAAREHVFDLTKAIYIGDDERDMAAGQAAGCKTILIS